MIGASGKLTDRRLALLGGLARTGSILRAARSVGMSYRGAWLAVEAMNSAAPAPLVERRAGGKGGGGTRLTASGKALLAAARRLGRAHAAMLGKAGRREGGLGSALEWMSRLSVRTSARNQLFGKVASIRLDAVNAEVILRLKGGDRLSATVTRESAEELGLRRGVEVFALVKASWVLLAPDGPRPTLSARNLFRGSVVKIVRGAVHCEVVLSLPGGERLAAVVTREAADELGLRPGSRAWALFKASSVILGVRR